MSKKDLVVCLHGITRDARMLSKLEKKLRELDYEVWNPSYPSTLHSIEKLTQDLSQEIAKLQSKGPIRLHFVGHSMGALIVRLLLKNHRPVNLGRVVMIAPPNKGSEVTDFMKRFRFYERTFGPAGQQIGTDKDSIIWQLPSADYELGIIAGDRSSDPWFSWFVLPGKGDGKVTIESTKLEGMKEHLIMHGSHRSLPGKHKVVEQIVHFIKHGKFKAK